MIRLFLAALLMILPFSAARSADWILDAAHSAIMFTGTQTGTVFTGHFAHFDASISLDPAHPETGCVKVKIDPASATTGDAQRDGALPGHDWFDVKTFPTALFEAHVIRRNSSGRYVADGMLILRGVSKPLSLPFTLQIDGATAHAHSHVNLTRTLFGVGQGPWANGNWVGLSVDVTIDIVAIRSP